MKCIYWFGLTDVDHVELYTLSTDEEDKNISYDEVKTLIKEYLPWGVQAYLEQLHDIGQVVLEEDPFDSDAEAERLRELDWDDELPF